MESAPHPHPSPISPHDRRRVAAGIVVLCLVHFALTLPVIFFAHAETIYSYDQANFHLPAIRQIAANWPRLDLLRDSLSAISPGYHYALATLARLIGDSERTMRLANAVISLITPLALFLLAARSMRSSMALLLALPLVASNFFVKSSCWVVTDNASLALVTLTLVAALRPSASIGYSVSLGALGALATAFRQLNVWLAGVLFLRMLLIREGARRFAAGLFAVLPLLVVAMLYHAWGGLVPPRWKEASVTFSLCPVAYLLAVFGVLGSFYLTALDRARWREWRACPWIRGALLIGVFIAVASPTTYSHAAGRWGGYFWSLIRLFPAVAERSTFFVIFTPIGCAAAAILTREIGKSSPRTAFLWLVSLLGWISVFLVNRQVFHRYFEPTSLLFLTIGITLASAEVPRERSRLCTSAFLLLLAMQVALTALTVGEAFGLRWVSSARS